MLEIAGKWSILLLAVAVLLSLAINNGEPRKGLASRSWVSTPMKSPWFSAKDEKLELNQSSLLQYDFYDVTCPKAEEIIHSTVSDLYKVRPSVAPALLRLVFHDCFIHGCDASVLLDGENGGQSEKDAFPNKSLRDLDVIDIVKSKLEDECPGTVSCADILVLAAREGVVLGGGPFYPLPTGRRDSSLSFSEIASSEIPSPHGNLSATISSFASRNFTESETVALLGGGHSIGIVHCQFFNNRLFNFSGTEQPDPSIQNEFLNLLRSRCNDTGNSSTSSIEMDNDPTGLGFGARYYQSVEQGRGILESDQHLMDSEGTKSWVNAYASNSALFNHDFSRAMTKLSSLNVLTAQQGQIRLNCSKTV